MLYSIENEDELKDLIELKDLQLEVKQVRLVEEVGKQGYHYDIKEVIEPITNSIKDISEDVTITMVESSKENNKALTTLNNKLSEIMNDRGIIASYLLSLLSIITNPEKFTQFKLVKDYSSNTVNDLLIHNTIAVS